MKKLYLFRHGETDYNLHNLCQGILDIPLNDTGRSQALELANRLSGFGIEIIYSSHLVRAAETAQIVAQKLQIPVVKHAGLQEVNLGTLAGKSKEVVAKIMPDYQHIRKDLEFDLQFPEGESRLESRRRILDAVLTIANTSIANNIGIASHGFVIRELLYALNFIPTCRVQNCNLFRLQYIETDKTLTVAE